MAIERGVLEVNAEAFDFLCGACKEPQQDVGKNEVLFDQEYKFANGYRMAIQCIARGNPAEESCWVQGVLFDSEGNELGTTDVGESFGGEYCVSHDGKDYIVEVIRKSGGNGGMAALLMGGVKEEPRKKKYAQIAWTAEDVLTLRPEWTKEQAEDFLCENERQIQDRTIEIGWEVLEALL